MVEVAPPTWDKEHVIGSAVISEQETKDEKFPVPRSEYLNALLSGDAAIMKHLRPNCEYSLKSVTNESSSEEDETPTGPRWGPDKSKKQKTLPLSPMIQLKRRTIFEFFCLHEYHVFNLT